MTVLEKQAKALDKEGYHYDNKYNYYYFNVALDKHPDIYYGQIRVRKIGNQWSMVLFYPVEHCIMSARTMDSIRWEMERIEYMLTDIYLHY